MLMQPLRGFSLAERNFAVGQRHGAALRIHGLRFRAEILLDLPTRSGYAAGMTTWTRHILVSRRRRSV